MENRAKSESPAFMLCLNVINTITHFLLGAIAFSAFACASAAQSINIGSWSRLATFSSHIYLCVIGYVILMTQAILVYNPYVGWAANLQLSHKRLVHVVLQILGSLLAIIGSIVKMSDDGRSLDSAHAVFGFIAMLLAILSLIGGILNFVFSQKSEKNKLYQLLYTGLNAVTISVAFISLAIAFGDYFVMVVANSTANFAISNTVFSLVGLIALVFLKFVWKG